MQWVTHCNCSLFVTLLCTFSFEDFIIAFVEVVPFRHKPQMPSSVLMRQEVTLRPIVSRPVCLGVRRPSGTRDQFYFHLEIFFRQLRVCNFVAPSLTRGRICNLRYNCFWASPEQSPLGRSPVELTAIFYRLI
jgi:hypothetical protein